MRGTSRNHIAGSHLGAMAGLACALTLAAAACGAGETTAAAEDEAACACPTGPAKQATDTLATRRASCEFGPDVLASATIGPEVIPSGLSKVKHVVILMQENRSFDHYFSGLGKADGIRDPVPSDVTNPSTGGTPVSRRHETRMCVRAPEHEWADAHIAYGASRMDGFVQASTPGGERAMGFYDEGDLPFYYALARRFAISERYFSSRARQERARRPPVSSSS